MQRPSLWPLLVVLLLGALFLREPRFQRFEENFLRWLVHNSHPSGPPIPLTVVSVNKGSSARINPNSLAPSHTTGSLPLELALFLPAILDFKPTIVAIEPVLDWTEREKEQEQIFVDQAMR